MVGCPRSGTSALAWALAQHPAFITGDETNFLWHLFNQDRVRQAWEKCSRIQGWLKVQGITWKEFAEAVGSGIERLFQSRAGGRRWVDNSPENLLIALELSWLFPSARFVHIVRDGRAVVNSMLHSGFDEPFAKDFDEACRTWAFYIEKGVTAQKLLGNRMYTVLHQWILDDPVTTCSEILRFLGEPYHPGPATFLSTAKINSSYGATSREDMKNPKDPRTLREPVWETWSPEKLKRFEEIAGRAMGLLAQFENRLPGNPSHLDSLHQIQYNKIP